MNFTIAKNEELSLLTLGTILGQFQTSELPKLQKLQDYYIGRQEIMRKQPSDSGKPCNRIMTNFCHSITNTFNGYLTGKPITYEGEDIVAILDVLNYNDVRDEDTNLLQQSLCFGVGYEILYIDEDSKTRFKYVDARNMIPVYSDDLNHDLLYVIRFQSYNDPVDNKEKYWVEVYNNVSVKRYISVPGFSSFTFVEEYLHHFNQVPVIVFELNENRESCYSQIITMQDAYNEIESSQLDSYDSFCDSYMVIKGMDADKDDLSDMKKHRVLLMDNDSDAYYLTKQENDTQVVNMLKNLNDNIWKISGAIDFGDERFMAQSGEALKWKLLNFETTSANIESHMKKALQKRIELIVDALMLVNGEEAQRDVKIIMQRNIPVSMSEIAAQINGFRGIVSTKTLLAQIPFVENVDEEMAQLELENKNKIQMYNFEEALEIGDEE